MATYSKSWFKYAGLKAFSSMKWIINPTHSSNSIMETQIFHHPKIIIFQTKSSKRNPIPSRYYNSIIELKVSTQAKKIISSFKNLPIEI
jgi:hypothetical protein